MFWGWVFESRIWLLLFFMSIFLLCRCVELEREAIRCFNCGSYSHGLRDCQRQLNYDAINSARSSHASKRNFSSGPRSSTRYYETHPDNEVYLDSILHLYYDVFFVFNMVFIRCSLLDAFFFEFCWMNALWFRNGAEVRTSIAISKIAFWIRNLIEHLGSSIKLPLAILVSRSCTPVTQCSFGDIRNRS